MQVSYSLTKTQKRVWFNAHASDKPIPNIALVFEIKGSLDISSLQKSIKHLVDTHSVLKSVIYSSQEYLERVINQSIRGHLNVVDISNTEKQVDVFWLLHDIAQTKFNLNTGPLFYFHLIKKQQKKYYFSIVIHPIIVDRYSLKYLVEELSYLYHREHNHTHEESQSVRENLADFNSIVDLEKKFQESEKYRSGLTHWTNTLKANQFHINLPKKSFFSSNDHIDGPFLEVFLSNDLRKKLTTFGQSRHIEHSTVLIAAYQLLLHKYTGNKEIIFNYSTPISYTNKKVFGCLDNRLPLRIVLNENDSFDDLIKNAHSCLSYDLFYKDIQINDIVKSIRTVYDKRFSGIFSNTSFDINYLPYDALKLTNTTTNLISKFMRRFVTDDLAIYYRDTGQEISLIADFDESLDHIAVKNLLNHYEVLLHTCLTHPDIPIKHHTLLTPKEYEQILIDWNRTEQSYDNKLVHRLFEDQVKQHPHNIAIVFHDECLSYETLNAKANQLAHYLKKILRQNTSNHTEKLVGICLDRGLNMVIGMLAALKAGAGYVPLDPHSPQERLLYILNDAAVCVVISESNVLDKLSFLNTNHFHLICLDQEKDKIEKESVSDLKTTPEFSSLAYMIYTSGSTGMPKGVMIEHKSLPNLIRTYQDMFLITQKKRVLQFSSMNFDAAVPEIFGTLTGGASLYIASEELRQSPEGLVKYFEDNHITAVMLPPALLKILPRHELPILHTLAFGGDVCDQETVDFWSRNRRFLNVYGPTETTVYATYKILHPGSPNHCIGKPIPNYTAYVLDTHLNPVPIGIAGELYIGGIGVGRGYLNRPEQTKKSFVVNPFKHCDSSEHLHKTGDIVRYLPNGDLEYIGRTDFEVKIRGFRIQLSDIEHVLNSVSEIEHVATKVWEHQSLGKVIACYYILKNYGSVSIAALREHIRQHLPDYMMPNYFIELEQMPISVSGKINKAALPNPFFVSTASNNDNTDEQTLREIWSELFKVPGHAISSNSDFFELGGHSLLATRLVSRLRDNLHIDIKVKDVFQNSHFNQMAKLIRDSITRQSTALTLCKAPKQDLYQPSYSQMRLWYFFKLMPQCPTYNIVFNIKFSNHVDLKILQTSITQLILNNETFRIIFSESDGIPNLKIQDHASFEIPIIDCQSEDEVQLEIEKEHSRIFDLTEFPLFYCKILQCSSHERRVIFNIHHILFDGGSLDVFMRGLGQIYTNILKNKPTLHNPADLDFKDFAYSQMRWMQEGLLTPQLSYWQRKLSPPLPVLDLPTDFKRPNELGFSGDLTRFALPSDLVCAAKKLAATQKCSLFSILLSVYYVFLYRLTHQSDVIVASPIANRTQAALEQLIGLYLNIVVYRTQFKPGQTFETLLKAIHTDVLDVQEHQDLPFDTLVDATQKERDLSRNPIFQTMFILQNGFAMSGEWEDSGIKYEIMEENTKTAKFDLTLVLYDHSQKNEIFGFFEFNTALFHHDTITRYTNYFQNILKAVVENSQVVIDTIQFLPQDEYTKILHQWNQTPSGYTPTTIHGEFEKIVHERINHLALVCENNTLTYQELNEQANQYARYLQKFYKKCTGESLKHDTIIGLYLDRRAETIIAILGILKAGAAYLPLDPDYPTERLQYLLNDSKAKLIITKEHLRSKLNSLEFQSQSVLCLDTHKTQIHLESKNNLAVDVKPYHLAYVIYTSGTTGVPKGVMIEHKGVPNLALASHRTFEIFENSRVLQFASINFDAAVWEIFSALLNGATLYIVPEQTRLSPDELAEYIDRNAITFALLPPALLRVMPHTKKLPSLQTLAFGGDVCDRETRMHWSQNRKFFNAYGPTETTVCATWGELNKTDQENKIGKPVEHLNLYVLDEHLYPVPLGVYGELHVGGVGLARGYLNRVDLTVTRFIVNPFSDNPLDRIYKTGDVVRWLSDGSLEYSGRSDFQVKIRGFRIELTEIEEVLNQHPAIEHSIVNVFGENIQKQLVGYFVLKKNQLASTDELQEYLKEKLPTYMVPSVFIEMKNIPISANGKIDRKALPKFDPLTLQKNSSHLAPRNKTEEKLMRIWNEIFKYEKIGVHDNFFALGGNSLLSMRLLSAVNKALTCDMHLKEFFQNPTIAGMANYISDSFNHTITNMIMLAQQDAKLNVLTTPVCYQHNDTPMRHVFLTGANGFLGVHLLNELLTQTNAVISCLIRGSSHQDIHDKMVKALQRFGLEALIHDSRVHLVKGDLNQPKLGMNEADWNFIASHCDTIYHNGAYVNHVYDYSMLKQTNVNSTMEVIQLATTSTPKQVNYISTLSVVNPSFDLNSEENLESTPPSESGYILTKWVCEHLLKSAAKKGLKVSILRPGNITGHSQTGAVAYEHNHALLLLKSCLQLGVAPEWRSRFEMTPVDYLSRMIVALTRQNKDDFQICNLANINTIRWDEYFSIINNYGLKLNLISGCDWIEKYVKLIDETNALYPFKEGYLHSDEMRTHGPQFKADNSKTQSKLEILKFHYPDNYEQQIKIYLDYLLRSGFLTNFTQVPNDKFYKFSNTESGQ